MSQKASVFLLDGGDASEPREDERQMTDRFLAQRNQSSPGMLAIQAER